MVRSENPHIRRHSTKFCRLRDLAPSVFAVPHYDPLVTTCLAASRGSVLAFGTQVRGFKPGRSRRIFQGEKIFSMPPFGREVQPFGPCRIFAACKRTQKNVCVEVVAFCQITGHFSPK